jgi:hypothetical protein
MLQRSTKQYDRSRCLPPGRDNKHQETKLENQSGIIMASVSVVVIAAGVNS